MKKCKCNRKKGIICDKHFFSKSRTSYERFLIGNSKTGASYPH